MEHLPECVAENKFQQVAALVSRLKSQNKLDVRAQKQKCMKTSLPSSICPTGWNKQLGTNRAPEEELRDFGNAKVRLLANHHISAIWENLQSRTSLFWIRLWTIQIESQ